MFPVTHDGPPALSPPPFSEGRLRARPVRPVGPSPARARRLLGLALAALLATAGVGPAAAQVSGIPSGIDDLRLLVFPLRYQPGNEALAMVGTLLSPRGTVEFDARSNRIVVRDNLAVLSRVAPALANFDHPLEDLRLEVKIIQAGPRQVGEHDTGLSPGLMRELSKLLVHYQFESYQLMAFVDLLAKEGAEVQHQIGNQFRISFKVGTVLQDRRLRLANFRVARATAAPAERPLLATNLTPWLDKTMILGLAKEEGSRSALLVAVTCRKAKLSAETR